MVARATLNEPRMWTAITASQSASRHLVEHHVAQDAGGIDDGVQGAECLQRLFAHVVDGVEIGDASELETALPPAVRISSATSSAGPAQPSSPPESAAAEIVDQHLRALARGDQRARRGQCRCRRR